MKTFLLTTALILFSIMIFSQSPIESMGDSLFEKKRYDEAIMQYSTAIHENKNSSELWFKRGQSYYLNENDSMAIRDYNKAIELDNRVAKYYSSRGQSAEFLGDFAAASTDYSKAIQLDSNMIEPYINKGNLLIRQKILQGAHIYFTLAIKRNPNQPADVYFARGYCYQVGFGALKQAIEDYEKVMEIDPQYKDVYLNYGNCLHELKEYDKAIDSYNKAQTHNPNNASIFSARGKTYFLLNQKDKACADLQRALALGRLDVKPLIDDNCK